MAGEQSQGIQIGERDKAIQAYYSELATYEAQHVEHELALRTAFQNLLAHYAQKVKWTLIPELTLANGTRPDGVLRDASLFYRGYWEAKDTHDDLDAEIVKKIARGYPTANTIFEDTRRAVLYQNGRRAFEADLRVPRKLADLLQLFFSHQVVEAERFEQAVAVFRERIPDLARELQALIARERQGQQNARFRDAFQHFYAQCQEAIDPKISETAVEEMLVQHLLTERLIRTIFNNPDFIQRNVIAQEIEKVIAALTSRSFNRNEFLRALDPYYLAIEQAAGLAAYGEDPWTERQRFLNMVYERFFQGYSVRQADTHGIVYTPPEIVDFMVASVDEVLKREFGLSEGIGQPGVKVLDPATGTGSYIVHILRRITMRYLRQKYAEDLFCNEIMLLPYYIACLNIEHAYYERTGEYLPFEGACFADTLDMAQHVAKSAGGVHVVARPFVMMTEENTERVEREQAADIMVIIGNPPYNAGQENENDNNKNREYRELDRRIRDTYVKDSQATLRNKLYDAYVRFFRWATDRLQGRDGIVCFVSNNGFVSGLAFDGFRKHLLQDFTAIYHLDLMGNARTSGERRRDEGGNIFDDKIRAGVGITLLIRHDSSERRGLWYHRVKARWSSAHKKTYVRNLGDYTGVRWQTLVVDGKHNWLVGDLRSEFQTFSPLGNRLEGLESETIFAEYGLGVSTNRDSVVYGFDSAGLADRVSHFIESYNAEVSRWTRAGRPKAVDDFLKYEDVKWSEHLKGMLRREQYDSFRAGNIRQSLYRPFCSLSLYYDPILIDRRGIARTAFPTPHAENEVICVTGMGNTQPFQALATNHAPDLHLTGDTQCFPRYIYNEGGSNRRENITDWVNCAPKLGHFQAPC